MCTVSVRRSLQCLRSNPEGETRVPARGPGPGLQVPCAPCPLLSLTEGCKYPPSLFSSLKLTTNAALSLQVQRQPSALPQGEVAQHLLPQGNPGTLQCSRPWFKFFLVLRVDSLEVQTVTSIKDTIQASSFQSRLQEHCSFHCCFFPSMMPVQFSKQMDICPCP